MSKLKPQDLRCEHLFEPRGLNTRQPRLSWGLEATGRNRTQTAYRIIAGLQADRVAAGAGDCWDTGKVLSGESLLIAYAGSALASRQTVHWAVQVWDECDEASPICMPASFHTGLLEPTDWHARWVTRALVPPGGRSPPQATVYDNPYSARPADYYRKDFVVAGRLRRAFVYVSALGLYELHVNGKPVSDEILAPGWTDYHIRVEYQTYDVTQLLDAGPCTLAAIVGEGWYCGRVAYDAKRAGSHWGVRPALRCQLHLEYEDGTQQTVISDGSWQCGNEAIVYSDLLLGEKYDARLEAPGWDLPGFAASGWWSALEFEPPPRPPRMDPPRGVPIRRTVELSATCLHRTQSGALIYDLGQNIAGRMRMTVTAPRDSCIVLRHGEALKPDGTLYTENLRNAYATDTFFSNGNRQVFEPRFTVHGFRYVEVSLPEPLGASDIELTGIAIHSDMPVTGSFACASDMVNRLWNNILWTQRGNFLSVPTDCPQRDERMGWLGDAQVFFNTAAFNMDTSAFFTKWLVDIADAQEEDGSFTDVAPSRVYTRFAPNGPKGAPGWGDAGVIIPWRMYQRYGDVDVLHRHYAGMVRWIDLIERSNPSLLREHAVNSNWGDWLGLGKATPKALVATAYWAHITAIMAKVARMLVRRQDEARFQALARDIGAAFRRAFLQADDRLAGDSQTAYLMALAFDLVEPGQRERIASHLLRTLHEADGHIQTGIHGIRFICPILSEIGASDQAYALLLMDTYPSWGFSIRNGATTIWERWDGWTPERGFQDVAMNSLNHYALGAIGEWLFARVAGIDADDAGPGYRRIRLRPLPTAALGWCRASYRSHLGLIRSGWQCTGTKVDWRVEVPANCTAGVELPPGVESIQLDGKTLEASDIKPTRDLGAALRFEIGSGEYAFQLALAATTDPARER